MPQVVALEEVKASIIRRGPREGTTGTLRTNFLKASSSAPELPAAYIIEYGPNGFSQAHYHAVDQFQILLDGKGRFGRHEVAPISVHFARAYTPYGPLETPEGWQFMTLRAGYDPGAQRLPDASAKLKQIPGRRPWQITCKAEFDSKKTRTASPSIKLQAIPGLEDECGMYGNTLSMPPDGRITAPDHTQGGGQFVIALKGSLWHEQRKRQAETVVYIGPDDPPFEIHAGSLGLEALILNFPARMISQAAVATHTASALKRWQCALCAFVYDEAAGLPEEGIARGTRWQDVPDTWSCPDCSAAKTDFLMVEI